MTNAFQRNAFQNTAFQFEAAVIPVPPVPAKFLFGGVGHYLLEREQAKQLAAITRKPPPAIDLRTAPQFKPIGGPPVAPAIAPAIAPQMPDPGTVAQMQAMARAKRRRDEEAILLLAN